MTRRMVIDLDEVDAMRLEIRAGIKNSTPEAEAKRLIERAIDEWIESLDENYEESGRSGRENNA